LFDLVNDRDELVNLCDNPSLADVVTAFRAEVSTLWDLGELHSQVLESQKTRRFISQSLRKGNYASWEYTPPRDSSTEYMRNHLDLNDVERLARWPR
jgi:choline-sulfatase